MIDKDAREKIKYDVQKLASLLLADFDIDEETAQFYAQYYFFHPSLFSKFDLDKFYNLQFFNKVNAVVAYSSIVYNINMIYSLDGKYRFEDDDSVEIVTP